MKEYILTFILGCGNLLLFIEYLIDRHDKKAEKEEDKEKETFRSTLKKLEKDGLRTQLLLLILLKPQEEQEILTIAEHYFVDLRANWYMSSIFKTWCDDHNLQPAWFDEKGENK